MRCNIFRNVWDTDCSHVHDVDDILEQIGLGRWKDRVLEVRAAEDKEKQKELKYHLPCATFSGVFNQRKMSELKEYTGFLVADVDKISREEKSKLRKRMAEDEHIYSFFDSPVKGLKALVRVNGRPEDHRTISFTAVSNYFKSVYGIEIDPSGKDLTRLCFVSFDDEIHYNPDAVELDVFNPQLSGERNFNSTKKREENVSAAETDIVKIYRTVQNWLNKSGDYYVKGNRNMYLFKAACELNRCGLSPGQIRDVLNYSHSISAEMQKELDNVIKSVIKLYSREYNTKSVWRRNRNQSSLM